MLIIGAGGFAKELLAAIVENDPNADPVFYDDVSNDLPARFFDKYQILTSETEAANYFRETDSSFALGIADAQVRFKLFHKFLNLGGSPKTIISANARVGKLENSIGQGVAILGNVLIEASNHVGDGSLVHVGSLISHDTKIGKFCQLSPFVKILGGAQLGDFCNLGTACIILPKVKLGNNVTVGAGAVVTRNVPSNTTVVGVPARPLQNR